MQGDSQDGTGVPEPIAIVGIGCRWPGGVKDLSQLWDLLAEGRDGWSKFKPDHINLDGFYHPNGQRPGSMFTEGAHLLQEDPRLFDHAFFGITAAEAMSMDPSQRKLLEVTYEAFENAGEPWHKFSGSRTGVFIGNFNNEHQVMQFRDLDHPLPYVVTGGGATILSNRISHVFNLRGPSMVVDTACSASMYALHLAVLSLRNGDCDAAIVGGGNLILSPDAQLFTTKLNAISPTSRSHTFDASADGYARAEGFGAIYIKRLSDALAQGDPIRAVIRATSFNHNGKTAGISHPSPEGQEAVIRQAYRTAGLDFSDTGYFECHGTGTPVGDPIEVTAIGRVFASVNQEEPLLIGSIKPNLGHSEPASALAQIMKVVLAMEHEEIPATIGVQTLNPAIDFEKSGVRVVTNMTPWPSNRPRRVSINSFGYGGANAHCILDHPSLLAPRHHMNGLAVSVIQRQPQLVGLVDDNLEPVNNRIQPYHGCQQPEFVQTHQASVRRLVLIGLSAHDRAALKRSLDMVKQSINKYQLSDFLYTLVARRSVFAHRSFAVINPKLISSSLDYEPLNAAKSPSIVVQPIGFVFTGQGAQWAGMGSKLIHEYEVFKQTIRFLDFVLSQLRDGPSWKIEEVLCETGDTSRIDEPAFSQTACTALQIALTNLLRQWGILPAVTVGHSSGEIAAAYAAGRLRASEAIVIAYYRGQVVSCNHQDGLMLAVGLGSEELRPYLDGFEGKVDIAAFNSPESTTISGDSEAIHALVAKLTTHNVFNRLLKTGKNAYHSHHMLSLGKRYEQLMTQGLHDIAPIKCDPFQSHATWVSSVTSASEAIATLPKYWRQNLERPVRFSHAMEMVASSKPVKLMIEVGPHPALALPLQQIGTRVVPTLATLRRGDDDLSSMLNLAGQLFVLNVPINLVAINATDEMINGKLRLCHGYPCIDMPRYSFSYPEKPLYFENRFNRELRQRRYLRHDLLGSRQPGGSKFHPSWRNVLRAKDLPWLNDHKLGPHPVLPAAAYIAMAVEAVRQVYGEETSTNSLKSPPIRSYRLRNVSITSALKLEDNEHGVETIFDMEKITSTASHSTSVWYKFSIGSMPAVGSETWTENCSGTISIDTGNTAITSRESLQIDSRARSLDLERWYNRLQEIGLGFGPTFKCLSRLQAYSRACSASADVLLNSTAGSITGGESEYALHPAALDACLQLAIIAVHSGRVENAKKAFVPILMNEVALWTSDSTESKGRAIATGRFVGQRSAYAQAQLCTMSGHPLLDIGELKCIMFDASATSESGVHTIREPFWNVRSMVDITTLIHNRHAKDTRLLMPLHEPNIKAIDLLCSNILIVNDHLLTARNANQTVTDPSSSVPGVDLEGDISEFRNGIKRLISELKDIFEVHIIEAVHNSMFGLPGWEIERIDTIKDIKDEDKDEGIKDVDKDEEFVDLDMLYQHGIFVSGSHAQLRFLLDLQAHKNPRMRILELRGHEGGITTHALQALRPNTYFKRFEQYVFTDSYEQYVKKAQTTFENYTGMSFEVLDIEQDPGPQGFSPQSFDLIIAGWALGYTTHPINGLRNIRALLRSGGALLMTDVTRHHSSLDFLSQYLDYAPYRTRCIWDREQWIQCLEEAGFPEAQVVVDDYNGENAVSTTILTRVPGPYRQDGASTSQAQHTIYLVYKEYHHHLIGYIVEATRNYGLRCIPIGLLMYDHIPEGCCVISLIDINESTLLHCGSKHFEAIQALIARSSVLLWIAKRSIETNLSDSAVMKGLLRSVATENIHLNIAHIEICSTEFPPYTTTAHLIAYKICELLFAESGATIDRECLIKDGVFYIDRLVPDVSLDETFRLRHRLTEDLSESLIDYQKALKPVYRNPGLLSSLYFDSDKTPLEPLEKDWIQIKTEAIGLNMKDIAVATAKFDSDHQSHEASGIVSEVGANVTSFKKGDRVFGLVLGNMGTYLRCPAQFVSKIPPGESFVSAASMPVSYLAVMYALLRLARPEKGESILVESAAGSAGIAAIQLAKYLGLTIYVTVGSDAKKDFLINEFALEPSHIFRSRRQSLPEEVMRVTGGRGVDIILSTTQGDMMHETWRCIAPLGRFIDLGRTGVLGAEKLSLEIFKRNATFASFDIVGVAQEKPKIIEQLMKELTDFWVRGVISPVAPAACFELSQLNTAMSLFTKGQHIGKVVIEFNKSTIPAQISTTASHVKFDPKASYLMIGCMGGLGRALSTWMVQRGARHLIFLTRSTTKTPEMESFLDHLHEMGASFMGFSCDITDYDSLASIVEEIDDLGPVKGVVHAAMTEGDKLFNQTTYDQIQAVLAPKVTGTLNLRRVTKDLSLDFFLMLSSLVGVIGTATQSAYCAANAFQNDFARQCRRQGFPATSLDLGLITEIGRVRDSKNVQKSLQRVATYGQTEAEFLQLVEGALCQAQDVQSDDRDTQERGHIITGLEPARLLAHTKNSSLTNFTWHKDARFQSVVQAVSDMANAGSSSKAAPTEGTRSLIQRLANITPPKGKITFVQEVTAAHFSELLGISADQVDVDKPLSHYGLDSLVAAELRSWVVTSFGVEVTALHLLSETATVGNLATLVVEELAKRKTVKG
ncbi:putative polyketide synthase [Astrocystis sublimbata]|nr:putative polyketide synthase [Astrocystis sublimbata]